MVKVVGRTLEEKFEEDRYDRFLEITRSVVEDQKISTLRRPTCFLVGGYIWVYPGKHGVSEERVVIVGNPDNYDLAFRLAESYEQEVGKEFTLRKDYEEGQR